MTDDKDYMKFKCATFNGDTADGRTKWPDWLRDIELLLDEWSWAVMSNEVLSHDMYERLDDKKKLKEDEEKAIKIMMDMACKSRAATKGRKPVKEWRKEMENDRDTFLMITARTITQLNTTSTETRSAASTSSPGNVARTDSVCNSGETVLRT